jgi:lipopolysaccharide heptosyltransferase II
MTQATEQPSSLDEYGYPTRPPARRTLRNSLVSIARRGALALLAALMSCIGTVLWLRRRQRLAHTQPLSPQTFAPKRVLVIRLDLIGDLVMSLPAIRVLKRTYPAAEIDLLALPSSATALADDPDLTRIFTYDPNIWRRPKALFQLRNWRAGWQLHQTLKARHYDLAISLYGNVAAILTALSGAKRVLGYGREGYPGLLTDSVPGKHWTPGDHLHEVDYCLKLAQAAGATISPGDHLPRLHVPLEAEQGIVSLLTQEGISASKLLVACHVSSHNGQSKRWPAPYWATLLDRLVQECNAQVVLTGAPADSALIHEVMSRMHMQATNLAGKTTLPQLAALFQRANLAISGDSGPMHIAEAVGTPLIAIHGPTDPALSGPVSPDAVILRSDIWCSPCYKTKGPADCRFYTTQCMKDITPARVFTTARQLLKRNASLVTQEGE